MKQMLSNHEYRKRLQNEADPSHAYGIAITAPPPFDFYRAEECVYHPQVLGDRNKAEAFFMTAAERVLGPEEKKSLLLHAALLKTILFIHVPAGVDRGIIDISKTVLAGSKTGLAGSKNIVSVSGGIHIVVVAERGSSCTVVWRGENTPRSFAAEFILGDASKVVFEYSDAVCEPSLQIFAATISTGAALTFEENIAAHAFFKARAAISLVGSGGSCTYKTGYRSTSAAVLDIERVVRHVAADTSSCIIARGVADGNAKAIWRGNVFVGKDAKRASAFLRHDAMLVGRFAEIDASPVLEIFTDDVSCKHSASVTHVRPEDIFYCMSRGISEQDAKEHIVEGFLRHA